MQDLTLALLQTDLIWENSVAGLQYFQGKLAENLPEADLFVLPEMFPTGFTMNAPAHAETMLGPVVNWMKEWACTKRKYLCGSVIIQENDTYYNRLLVFGPEGLLGYYDKKHLFRMAGEDQVYTSGNARLVLPILNWKVSFWICYDLRFPVWMRNQSLEYDAGIVVANWPDRRVTHWSALLKARAIENQAYFAGVNRNGMDGNGIEYSGKSEIIHPLGTSLASRADDSAGWLTASLSYSALQDYREKFAAWKDADSFTLK
jgi:predicted amidohydrolase